MSENINTMEKSEIEVAKEWIMKKDHVLYAIKSDAYILDLFRSEVIKPFLKNKGYIPFSHVDRFELYQKEVLQNQPEPVNDDNVGDGKKEKLHSKILSVIMENGFLLNQEKWNSSQQETRAVYDAYRIINLIDSGLLGKEKTSLSLSNYLRNKLQEVEENHSYEIATDSIRAWIDEHNPKNLDLLGKLKEAREVIEWLLLNCTPDKREDFETFHNAPYNFLESLKHIL